MVSQAQVLFSQSSIACPSAVTGPPKSMQLA
jgi:hypothetical protein